ncbi:hypothetical protein ADUPG1_009460 [Aduncisulcus paluster]|uniref:Uncharacterized protein n=1 Tax=Aduncisulcus paluster TaxID=2918883 RepID=A0ABQ5KZN2_9EUKA|nr:hypothetical protein ADUPG1_009460 [Aduncisulcus paluster]
MDIGGHLLRPITQRVEDIMPKFLASYTPTMDKSGNGDEKGKEQEGKLHTSEKAEEEEEIRKMAEVIGTMDPKLRVTPEVAMMIDTEVDEGEAGESLFVKLDRHFGSSSPSELYRTLRTLAMENGYNDTQKLSEYIARFRITLSGNESTAEAHHNNIAGIKIPAVRLAIEEEIRDETTDIKVLGRRAIEVSKSLSRAAALLKTNKQARPKGQNRKDEDRAQPKKGPLKSETLDCIHCGGKTHKSEKCWIKFPHLRPKRDNKVVRRVEEKLTVKNPQNQQALKKETLFLLKKKN